MTRPMLRRVKLAAEEVPLGQLEKKEESLVVTAASSLATELAELRAAATLARLPAKDQQKFLGLLLSAMQTKQRQVVEMKLRSCGGKPVKCITRFLGGSMDCHKRPRETRKLKRGF